MVATKDEEQLWYKQPFGSPSCRMEAPREAGSTKALLQLLSAHHEHIGFSRHCKLWLLLPITAFKVIRLLLTIFMWPLQGIFILHFRKFLFWYFELSIFKIPLWFNFFIIIICLCFTTFCYCKKKKLVLPGCAKYDLRVVACLSCA